MTEHPPADIGEMVGPATLERLLPLARSVRLLDCGKGKRTGGRWQPAGTTTAATQAARVPRATL